MSQPAADKQGLTIHISGVVQGVGFRPFVYGLAQRFNLSGWVRNTSSGVDIEVDGPAAALAAFETALQEELPPLARIDAFQSQVGSANGFTTFEIRASQAEPGAFQPISPDMTICDDCLREMADPSDRRYRYPFINCTNCGPRYTIIKDIPYDRPETTMAVFPMCPECAAEYHDPLDRRFHAQPVACPVCGPHVWLADEHGEIAAGPEAIEAVRERLAHGSIVAVKGLGGFHLACDATDAEAVAELRRRKLRVDKPFAVMMPDLATVEAHCYVNVAEAELLLSRARPIVLLQRRPESNVAAAVAPGQNNLGVMLPYTPLHHLLLEKSPDFPEALVMTSGNLSEEPIAYTNAQAVSQLASLADVMLLHNREIYTRCDDSVMCALDMDSTTALMPVRRSRGYAPFPVRLPFDSPSLLATGAELKNTFCLVRDDYAFLSQHIGDMANFETLQSFEQGVAHMEKLFRIRPELIAYDLHPDYMATRYALERATREGLPSIGVQHHHAHIAAGMAEHKLDGSEPVIGLAFDGTGYGDDGAIWGGELLIATYAGYERTAHLPYVPLPGGDRAVREPWRMALAWLSSAGLAWNDDLPPVRYANEYSEHGLAAVRQMLTSGLNAPPTSSMGRLFDAFAALIGIRQTVNYEAQAAIELEAIVDLDETNAYSFAVTDGLLDPRAALVEALSDWRAGVPPAKMAARFHQMVAQLSQTAARQARGYHRLSKVVLSGGVWQNRTLLIRTAGLLEQDGFEVLIHQAVPPNDGGLSLGQAAIAAYQTAASATSF